MGRLIIYHSGVMTRNDAEMILAAGDSIMSSYLMLSKTRDKMPPLLREIRKVRKLKGKRK